jgi:hypothetical protein
MRPTDFPSDAPARERYPSLASFYRADPRRIESRELDVGLWWRDDADGPLHRAAWVDDTGELYLAHLGPAASGGGTVEVLATFATRELLERALLGWQARCGEPGSLGWLRGRVARLRRFSIADGARARRRAVAPTVRPSRQTAGTAA